jgi:hypothetical protein
MDSLYQRLKELDPDTFQRFCCQLLKERHPEQEIKQVEVRSGDEGLDIFTGELYGKPTIWQCKSFPNGIGDSQKEQIRESLRTALKHFSPSFWILCLSIDMDVKAARWFEKLKNSYASKVTIGGMLASEIVNEVLHRRSLRTHFFPNASLDVLELKRMALRTSTMTREELEGVTDANLEDIIERWKESDPRFNYQIVFGGDMGPPSLDARPPNGLVMSVLQGGKTVNVFARDIAALRADPPKFSTTIQGTGVEKYLSFIKTGIPQEFEAHEVGPIKSNWALMSDMSKVSGVHKLSMAPSPQLTSARRNVRLEFVSENSAETVRYESAYLRFVRGGTEELEFAISGGNMGFRLSLIAPIPQGDVDINVKFDDKQKNLKIIKKTLDALSLLRPSGKMLIFDLETEKYFLESTASLPDETPQQAARRSFVNDLTVVANRFAPDLEMPDKIAKSDLETIYLLKQYAQSGTIELDDISFVLTKSEENKDLVPQQFAGGKMQFRFENLDHEPLPKLFGRTIRTGPVVTEADVDINDLSATLARFKEASIGEGVRISTKPFAPVRVSLASV